MRWAIALCALAIPTATLAQPVSPPRPSYLKAIPWAKRPTPSEFSRLYPMSMARAEQTGLVVQECRVADGGALDDCRILHSTPANRELDPAARKAVALMRVKPETTDGVPTTGKLAVVTLVFAPSFAHPPLLEVTAGNPAMLVTPTHGELPRLETPCPTTDEPARKCFWHDLSWDEQPDFGLAADHVLRIGKTVGRSVMECTAVANAPLSQCSPSSDLTPDQIGVLAELLAHYRPPEKTRDGLPVAGGRIVMLFEWPKLLGAIERSAVKLSR